MCRCPYICIQYIHLTPYSCYIYTVTTSISFASVCCYENNQRDVLYVNLRQPVGVCICVCVFACSERAQLWKTNAYSMCALEHLRLRLTHTYVYDARSGSFCLSRTRSNDAPQIQSTAVKGSVNPLMCRVFDSRSRCSVCVNPSVLHELSPELESAKKASEKVTELLLPSTYSTLHQRLLTWERN